MTGRDEREAAGPAGQAPPVEGPGETGVGSSAWRRETAGLAVIFLFIAVFMILDLLADLREGASTGHLAAEMGVALMALGGLVVMWRRLALARRSARALQVALDGTRADLAHWRSEAQAFLQGLGAAIDGQFNRWGLSPAEREVALLLLKGLSLREVAEARSTSERTVRQQALAVYRKAGLAGRAELSAFFLEDLLLPREGWVAAHARRG